MTTAALIYPHQLFDPHPALDGASIAVLVEDPLFFTQYPFHKQKLMLHRASLKRFAADLIKRGFTVRYVEAGELKDSAAIGPMLKQWKDKTVQVVDVCDDWLNRRLHAGLQAAGITLKVLPDPHYLTSREQIDAYTGGKKRLFFTDFYIQQRKRLDVLLTADGKPEGGQWSYDPENRKKLPASLPVPDVQYPKPDQYSREAQEYVAKHFPKHFGNEDPLRYPTSHRAAEQWLEQFLSERFAQFGDYEDAISTRHEIVFHSMLTPMLNIGLLSPQQVVAGAMAHAERAPLNSREGFLRQVIGWREFMRLVYLKSGSVQRTRNFWNFKHPMPAAFYDGTTGIAPVDHVIRQVLRTGYCHHIERLMVLGNFLLLCEVHPDAVYQWFMELFIDAYDWVMVPNVYGMSQYADGGHITTKPYISGSAYVLKMSDFKKGPWCPIWDALYWRFIDAHAEVFAGNPRSAMMVKLKDKLGAKLDEHRRVANEFLQELHR